MAHPEGDLFVSDDEATPDELAWGAAAGSGVYFTKRTQFREHVVAVNAVTPLGGPGIPKEERLDLLESARDGRKITFIGDLDGTDLSILTCLRERVGGVVYAGVSDRMIELCDATVDDMAFAYIDSPSEERDLLGLLACDGFDWRRIVGCRCAALLESGRKIEVEGAIYCLGVERVVAAVRAITAEAEETS
jgi:hypothetical protein